MDRLHLRQKHREFIHRQNMERLSIRQKHREFKHRRTWSV